jgi:hypothetical protein
MLNSKTMMLPIDSLKVDEIAYQRLTNNADSRKLIKEIGADFDEVACGAITLSQRCDGYYIIDGHHRVMGAKLAGKKYILCIVASGLSVPSEAKSYGKINGKRKKQTYSEMTKADITALNPEILDIKDIVERFGFKITHDENGMQYITAIKELKIIYKRIGRANFTRLFYLLRRTWNGERYSYKREMLIGVSGLIEKAGNKIIDSEFIKKMSKVAPIDIIKDAKVFLLTSSDKNAYAKAVLKHFNNHRTIGRISESIFYDVSGN